MASTVQVPEVAGQAQSAKLPLVPLLLVCVVTAVLAVGGCAGVLFYFVHSGRLGGVAGVAQSGVAKDAKAEDAPTKNVALEPLLVNLADDDGHAYLRLGLVLAEEVSKDAKPAEEKPGPEANAAVRDAVLDVLGKKHAAELLQSDGKDALKKELKAALDARVPEAKVRAVYFTDFLVQR
jgi:flagellar FliL protein